MGTEGLSRRIAAIQPSLIRVMHDLRKATSLDLGLGQPVLPVPAELLDEGLRRLRAGAMGYTANAGLPGLRERIAAHHRIPGGERADNVVVTCGSQEAIAAISSAVLDPGDEVLVPDPGFAGYRLAVELSGGRCVPVARGRANGFRLEADGIARACTPKTRLVIVNSPGNPTGAIDREDENRKLAKLAEEKGFFILSDEIYSDLRYAQPERSPAFFGDRTIVVNGLSKNCAMTGFRLGYAIAREPVVIGILRAHAAMTSCAPVLSQHMAQVAFENPHFLTGHLAVYEGRRKSALESLRKHLPADVSVLEPDGAFYVMIDCAAYSGDSFELAKRILSETDVVTIPGLAFGEVTRSWLRLSFADDPAIFEEGVARIGRFLRASVS